MKIGFFKMGLKTYFEKDKSKAEGFNHELCDIFDIFEKQGHECVMLSVSDKYKKYEGTDLDYIFLFNGPTPTTESGRKMMMFKNYSFPIIDFINSNNIPYVYFWTDCRYDIRENKLFNRQPQLILSQESEHYGHLDKLCLYKKELKPYQDKTIKLGILLNDTDKRRSKSVLANLKWLNYGELRGKWKETNRFLKESINEKELDSYLSSVKYSYNEAVNPNWVSQKYWEMILNNVICFYRHYDKDNLLITIKVNDEIDLEESINKYEDDENDYIKQLASQLCLIRDEYLDGSFIYKFIIEKLCQNN